MASIRKSLALSFASRYSSLAISIVSVVILARLLTPAEIGIYSVGMAVAALAHVVRDFGVGNYLIQETELTQDRIRTAMGMAILIAWAMAIILFASSGAIARFYDEPGLRQVLIVLSATFLIIPIGSPVLALLRRDLAFGTLYVIGVASTIAHATTAIALAWLGFGFMSLAWASLAGVVATTLGVTCYRPSQTWMMPTFGEWRRLAHFGSVMTSASIVSQIGVNAIDLILGRLLGFAAVGLYSRAQGLVALFHRDVMSAIRNVALPAFALEHRKGRSLETAYLRGVCLITVFAWPFYGFLALMAYPIVRILFGSQWDAAISLVQILSLAVAVGTTWNLIGNVLTALGHVNRILISEIIIQSSRIILILVAVDFGLEAVAYSQILVYIIGAFIYHWHLFYVLKLSWRDVFSAILPSLWVSLCSLLPPLLVASFMDINESAIWSPFLLALIGTVLCWFVSVAISSHPAKQEILFAFVRITRRNP